MGVRVIMAVGRSGGKAGPACAFLLPALYRYMKEQFIIFSSLG